MRHHHDYYYTAVLNAAGDGEGEVGDAASGDRILFDMYYKSKFILDSFIFCVSPTIFLRRLAANVDFSTRSRVYSCDLILQMKF